MFSLGRQVGWFVKVVKYNSANYERACLPLVCFDICIPTTFSFQEPIISAPVSNVYASTIKDGKVDALSNPASMLQLSETNLVILFSPNTSGYVCRQKLVVT